MAIFHRFLLPILLLISPSVMGAEYWARTTTSESCDTLCGRGAGACDQAAMYHPTKWTDAYMKALSSAFGCPCSRFEASTMPSVPLPFGGGDTCWYPNPTLMTSGTAADNGYSGTAADVCAAPANGRFCACTACPTDTSPDPTPAVLEVTTCISGASSVPTFCSGFTQTCPAGRVKASNSALCVTATGYSGEGATIAACAAGKYKATTGSAACTACPENTGITTTGSVALSNCIADAGYTGDGTNVAACAAGKYKATTGSAACTACPVDTPDSPAGSDAAADCIYCTNAIFSENGKCTCKERFSELRTFSTVHVSNDTGTTFYMNRKTGESTWDDPEKGSTCTACDKNAVFANGKCACKENFYGYGFTCTALPAGLCSDITVSGVGIMTGSAKPEHNVDGKYKLVGVSTLNVDTPKDNVGGTYIYKQEGDQDVYLMKNTWLSWSFISTDPSRLILTNHYAIAYAAEVSTKGMEQTLVWGNKDYCIKDQDEKVYADGYKCPVFPPTKVEVGITKPGTNSNTDSDGLYMLQTPGKIVCSTCNDVDLWTGICPAPKDTLWSAWTTCTCDLPSDNKRTKLVAGKKVTETRPCELDKPCAGVAEAEPVKVAMALSGAGLWDWVSANQEKFKAALATDIAATLRIQKDKITDIIAKLAASSLLRSILVAADQTVDITFTIQSGASNALTPAQLAESYTKAVANGTANFSSTEATSGVKMTAKVTGVSAASVSADGSMLYIVVGAVGAIVIIVVVVAVVMRGGKKKTSAAGEDAVKASNSVAPELAPEDVPADDADAVDLS